MLTCRLTTEESSQVRNSVGEGEGEKREGQAEQKEAE